MPKSATGYGMIKEEGISDIVRMLHEPQESKKKG